MRLKLLGVFIFLSFTCRAQEIKELPEWARVAHEFLNGMYEQKTGNEFEYIVKYFQPKVKEKVKAKGIEWFRSQFCAKSFENISKNIFAREDTMVSAVSVVLKHMTVKIGLDFISIAFVFLMNGVDINQVSELTLQNMAQTLVQSQTENALARIIVKNGTDGCIWRWCKDTIRSESASFLIKITKSIVLPALKTSAIACGKYAITAQRQEEKRMAHIFKRYLPIHGNGDELNYERLPIPIYLTMLQRNTRWK